MARHRPGVVLGGRVVPAWTGRDDDRPRDLLLERGTELDRVHVELFHGFQKPNVADDFTPATVKVRRPGEQHEVRLVAGDTVLESALKAGLDAPLCLSGRGLRDVQSEVLQGSVAMEQNFALSQTVVDAVRGHLPVASDHALGCRRL